MLLFGHKFIPSQSFYHITDIDAILKTPPSSTLYLLFNEENLDIITYLKENLLSFAVGVKNLTELIYASSLGASYIILDKELATTAQKIAETYLFDAKILAIIEREEEIEELALLGIDGVIFPNTIMKV